MMPVKNLKTDKLMKMVIFYLFACMFMAVSAYLSGLVWKEANGPLEYIRLLFADRPVIVLVTVVLFVASGTLTQIGKVRFDLSYYEISIIWLATTWVSVIMLWFVSGIKPTVIEFAGFVMCQAGLIVVAVSKLIHE